MEEKKKVLSREQAVGTPNLAKKKMKNQILLLQPRESGVCNGLQSSFYETQQFIFQCSPIIGNETTLVTVAVQPVDIFTLAQLLWVTEVLKFCQAALCPFTGCKHPLVM